MSWARECEERMNIVLDHFQQALNQIRTGRAQTSLLDGIKVSYYGTLAPLNTVASITAEGNQVIIQPFDRNALGDIELAIRQSGLDLNPVNDGALVRIVFPPLTEERRGEFIKHAHDRAEEARIAIRTVRKLAWEEVQEQQKRGELTEDDRYRREEELNKLIETFNHKILDLIKQKEDELKKP